MHHMTIYRHGFAHRKAKEQARLAKTIQAHFMVEVDLRDFHADTVDPSPESVLLALMEGVRPVGISAFELHASAVHVPPVRRITKDEMKAFSEGPITSMMFYRNILEPQTMDGVEVRFLSLVDTVTARRSFWSAIGSVKSHDHLMFDVAKRLYSHHECYRYDELAARVTRPPFADGGEAQVDDDDFFYVHCVSLSRLGLFLSSLGLSRDRFIWDPAMSWVMFTHHDGGQKVYLHF